MNSTYHHQREILSLKSRALTILVDNYTTIFQNIDHHKLRTLIPKPFLKEIFSRLAFKGILEGPLFRLLDQRATIIDLKSIRNFNNAACSVLKNFSNLRTLYLDEVCADSESLCDLFSTMYKLSILEITKSPSFNDSVAKVMSESCPCLRVLNANRTGLGDEGLIAFGQNSLTFVALDISNTSVSYAGIQGLLSSPTKGTLKELKCRGTKVNNREDILTIIMGFQPLEEYTFDFASSDDATWVMSRVTKRPKNCYFSVEI
ncbi:uncharacterized protein LOC110860526 [Folsomia candida]|uniref:uncharacterized protein LOC110860526 n=1 Tax=Folsomia candida TaxID=158441 RepID=UPI000B90A2E2|nr:uncharacterized protein LOC110860526 [Folsomia candida]